MPRLLFLVIAALAAALPAFAELPETVTSRLAAAGIPEDAMAAIVKRVPDGKVVLAHNAERSMQPASTLKLVTSLAALELLGPSHRSTTELRTNAVAEGGVLKGDLILRGGGDMDFDVAALQRMLRVLRLSGVREIRGDLVLDRSAFQPARTDVGLAPFDETPEFRYNVIPDALLVNSNLVRFDIVSGAREARASMTPLLAGVAVDVAFNLEERPCESWEDGWKIPEVKAGMAGRLRVKLHGTFPKDCTVSTDISVLERDTFVDRLFREQWRLLGGSIRGRTREGQAPADTRLLAQHRSRPLGEVVFDINKDSDNPNARLTYLAIGAHSGRRGCHDRARRGGRGARVARAQGHRRRWPRARRTARACHAPERIRPTQLAAVLEAALASPWSPEFQASLPIVAVDGGMRKRLRGTPAAERSRIKTGTLRDVSAVAGYLKDADGVSYIVVAMVNHERAVKEVARPILDALLEWVVAPRERARTAP